MNPPRTPDIFVRRPGPTIGPYYAFECGCILPLMMFKRRRNAPYMCPKCEAVLDHKIFVCLSCGKAFEKPLTTSVCKRCSDCAKSELRTHFSTLRALPVVDDAHIEDTVIESRTDCLFRDECLITAMRKNKRYLPCRGCEKYISAPLHATVNAYRKGYASPNFGCSTNWVSP